MIITYKDEKAAEFRKDTNQRLHMSCYVLIIFTN